MIRGLRPCKHPACRAGCVLRPSLRLLSQRVRMQPLADTCWLLGAPAACCWCAPLAVHQALQSLVGRVLLETSRWRTKPQVRCHCKQRLQ